MRISIRLEVVVENTKTSRLSNALRYDSERRSRRSAEEARHETAKAASSARSPASGVYVISSGRSAMKIGIAKDIAQRLTILQGGNPTALCVEYFGAARLPGMVERVAHSILWSRRIRREWFAVTAQEAVAAVAEGMRQSDGLRSGGTDYGLRGPTAAMSIAAQMVIDGLGTTKEVAERFNLKVGSLQHRVKRIRDTLTQMHIVRTISP